MEQQTQKLSELAEMIKYMAKMLVDFSDQVDVKETHGENTTVIELKVVGGARAGSAGVRLPCGPTVLAGGVGCLQQETVEAGWLAEAGDQRLHR